jgi:DNA polymerase
MKNLKNALLLKQLYQLKNLGYRYTSVSIFKDEEPNLTLPHSLEELKKQAHNCHLCTLSKTRNKVVFGEGNSNATLMFVGDMPSSSDDSSGKIWSDRAGSTLNKMIENVLGLTRETVYCTNILKCRAQDTLNPSSSHTHTCYPYLLKEIELVSPKIIVAFGELAYTYLTQDDSPIEKIHGMVYQAEHYKVIGMYHPNHLLKNPSLKKEVFEDLKKLKALL